jgi:CIC family chloride channel protein
MKTSWLSRVFQRVRSSEFAFGTTLAVVIGIVAGLGAVFFRWLISSFQQLFFNGGAVVLSFLGQYYVILLPAIGGLVVGLLIYFSGASEAKGHGVPEVMEAVAVRGGRIRSRVAAVKILSKLVRPSVHSWE